MDTRVAKIFLACALGGGVGSVVALSLSFYFWWIGLLVGAATGYFSYEFRKVLRATRVAAAVAWRETVSTTPVAFAWIFRVITSPGFRVAMLRGSIGVLSPIALASSLTLLYLGLHAYVPLQPINGTDPWITFIGIGGSIAMLAATILPIGLAFSQEKGGYQIGMKGLGITALCLTPLGLGLLAVGLPLFSIGWTLLKSPKIAKFCVVFVKTLFLTIHSDIRLLCGVDAAIGTLIGFFLINPIIGAVAGGIIGVLNYKLISQQWLHLRPIDQNG